jgi:hypothetical protein
MDERTHSVEIDGQRHVWRVTRLWQLADGLPAQPVPLSEFDAIWELDCWFGTVHTPTVGRVLDHLARIQQADLAYPILLSDTGVVMDGLHRLCKARLRGHETIQAVRFSPTPPADRVEPAFQPEDDRSDDDEDGWCGA